MRLLWMVFLLLVAGCSSEQSRVKGYLDATANVEPDFTAVCQEVATKSARAELLKHGPNYYEEIRKPAEAKLMELRQQLEKQTPPEPAKALQEARLGYLKAYLDNVDPCARWCSEFAKGSAGSPDALASAERQVEAGSKQIDEQYTQAVRARDALADQLKAH